MALNHETIIYGMIDAGDIEDNAHHELNRTVLAQLPEIDQDPPLTSGMFAVTGKGEMYQSQIIHFAASIKALEANWHVWLEKFEHLLGQLHWFGVILHLESELFEGDYQYQWVVTDESVDQDLFNSPIRPVSAWEFSGGPRRFDL